METNSTLLQMAAQASELQFKLMESGGLVTAEIEALLPVQEVNLPEKVENYVFMIQQLRLQAAHFKGRADHFYDISKSFEKNADFMEERIKEAAMMLGVSEIVGTDHKFSIRNTGGTVEITNEDLIEPIYKKEVITYKVSKTKIAEDLKLGLPVAGAYLRTGKSVSITANRKFLK
jgi:hypothetical protein